MSSSDGEKGIVLGQMIVSKIAQEMIHNSYLSVPGWDGIANKNGLCRDKKRAVQDPNAPVKSDGSLDLPYRSYDEDVCLFSYEEHLERLNLKPEDPWLLIGARNLGNNLRIVGYDFQRGVLELDGESAISSDREYCCLCKTQDGNLIVDRVSFASGIPSRKDLSWAVSGQELVWDGKPSPIEKIIPYTYDLRHVWRIEGRTMAEMGARAYGGDLIEEMIDRFMELSDGLPSVMSDKLIRLAEQRGYSRERHYLHNAIGVTEDGKEVVIVQRHGSFEDVGETLARAGAFRAIELDQGGSCSVMMGGTDQFIPGRTIFASHYFRPRGSALLIFKLSSLSAEVFAEDSSLL